MRDRKITIFFPVHNERETLRKSVEYALSLLSSLSYDYEVIVVDDASTDGSREIANKLAQEYRNVHVVQHKKNRGYGTALRSGFYSASKDLVFYTDADLPVDITKLKDALPKLDGADMVIGYRDSKRDSIRRYIYSHIYNTLNRLLFKHHFRDVNYSFKLMRREIFEDIRLTAETVFIDGELLAEAKKRGLKIREMKVPYLKREYGESSFGSLSYAFKTLLEMLRYWKKALKERKSPVQ